MTTGRALRGRSLNDLKRLGGKKEPRGHGDLEGFAAGRTDVIVMFLAEGHAQPELQVRAGLTAPRSDLVDLQRGTVVER